MATYEENHTINQTRPFIYATITGFNAAREQVNCVQRFNSLKEVRQAMKDANKGFGVYVATLNDGTKI